MRLLKLLEKAILQLQDSKVHFAVCGGIAADFYRTNPRVTDDVDIAIVTSASDNVASVAENVIESLGLRSYSGFIAMAGTRLPDQIPIVMGRSPDTDSVQYKIDFLLPTFPWVEQAVQRAQYNKVDFGFALVPLIPPEDLIVSKLFALEIEPDRFQDLDDLRSIFLARNDLDIEYIRIEMERLDLKIPDSLRGSTPEDILKRLRVR